VLGFCPLLAQEASTTLTINISGTLGPILSGLDPLKGDGGVGSLAITASESLSTTSVTATSATYKLPAGAVSVTVGTTHYVTTSPSKLTIRLTSTADILIVSTVGPLNAKITGTAYLAAGSWRHAVLLHPTTFSPSPQNLTPAATAAGPGSKVKYTLFGATTVLGITATISDKVAADPVLPDDDTEQ